MKEEKLTRGFSQLSRAWYAEANLKGMDYKDEVCFGLYYPDGSTEGEMVVQWIELGNKIVPKWTIFSDAWKVLSSFHDLIDLLREYDSKDLTPEQFCKCLLECGFVDQTKTKRFGD